MGFNVTWLTAHEESLVDDNLDSFRLGGEALKSAWPPR